MVDRLSIVHVLAPGPFGGAESVIETLAKGQVEEGDRVLVVPVVTGDPAGHPFVTAIESQGLDTAPISVSGHDYGRERAAVREVLASRAADVLHTHGYRPDVLHGGAARRMGVPTVSTVHGFTGGGWKNRCYEYLQRRALRRFDAVLAVSGGLEHRLAESGVPAERVHLVRNAWRPAGESISREAARAELSLPAEGHVIGWVGRMSQEKAPDVMIKAFAAMEDPAVFLSFVGDGPLEMEVRALADVEGVSVRCRWHGVVPGAGRYLRAFDAIVLTSWTEGTPMVLLEAMAHGVPVVTTAVGGIPDMVSAREARLVEAGDIAALAAAIDGVLSGTDGAEERSVSARLRLAEDFSVRPWVQRHRQIYQSVVSATSATSS